MANISLSNVRITRTLTDETVRGVSSATYAVETKNNCFEVVVGTTEKRDFNINWVTLGGETIVAVSEKYATKTLSKQPAYIQDLIRPVIADYFKPEVVRTICG